MTENEGRPCTICWRSASVIPAFTQSSRSRDWWANCESSRGIAVYPFVPTITTTDFFYYCFHPWVLMIIMVVFAFIGWGRIFEGKDGKAVKGNFINEVPAEVANIEAVA